MYERAPKDIHDVQKALEAFHRPHGTYMIFKRAFKYVYKASKGLSKTL